MLRPTRARAASWATLSIPWRHAGNNGDAAGRETARHIGGHRESLGSGPARAHNGKGRSLQQGNIAPAVQQHRRVGQFAQLPGIAGVCPEQDARVQAAGLIPLFPRGDPPGTGTHFPRPAACSNRLRPSVAAPAKPDRQNRRHAAGAHGERAPVPGSDKGQTGPVFPTGGFIHGRQVGTAWPASDPLEEAIAPAGMDSSVRMVSGPAPANGPYAPPRNWENQPAGSDIFGPRPACRPGGSDSCPP